MISSRATVNKHVSSIKNLITQRRRIQFFASPSFLLDGTGRSPIIGIGASTSTNTNTNTSICTVIKCYQHEEAGATRANNKCFPKYYYDHQQLRHQHHHGLTAKSFFSTSSKENATNSNSNSNISDDDDDDDDDHAHRPYDSYEMLESIVSSSAIAKKVQHVTDRYDDIMSRMINGNTSTTTNNNNNSNNDETEPSSSYSVVGEDETKELSSLSQIAKLYTEFKVVVDEMNDMSEFMKQAEQEKDEGDDGSEQQDSNSDSDELISECMDEIQNLEQTLTNIGEKVVEAIVPHDENDYNTDAIVELRAGTGGDEASLFCGELMSCYEKVASNKGWMFEVLVLSKSDLKGVKEAAISISSSSNGGGGGGGFYNSDNEVDKPLGPYGYFKFESGVHRVQRVPINDVRIHTSAASVAVLPAPNSSKGKADDSFLPASELKIETMRASGAGGQHVNTTDSAVRITHIPTGITASIQDERSQHKNKAKAIKLISARVKDKLEAEEARKRGDAKASLMGGGDRSERIRTYNFPQDRVTDHRCKHSEYGIEKLLSGGSGGADNIEDSGLVGMFLPHMKKMERVELMKSLEEEETETGSRGKGKKKR